jgi:ERCC4-type nuclease
LIVVFDQRENKPWPLPGVETEETHLETGDYTVKGFEDRFAVERKSIDDLTRSVGTDRDRFEAEIRRAQEMDEFVVVIEGSKQDVLDHDYYSQIHPNAVIGTVEKWPLKYGTLDFIWAGDREQAGQQCLRLLDRWYLIHGTDLF